MRIRSLIPFEVAFEISVTKEEANSKQSSTNHLLRLLWDKQPGHHPEPGPSPGHRNLWLPLLYRRSDCGHRALFCCKNLLIEIFSILTKNIPATPANPLKSCGPIIPGALWLAAVELWWRPSIKIVVPGGQKILYLACFCFLTCKVLNLKSLYPWWGWWSHIWNTHWVNAADFVLPNHRPCSPAGMMLHLGRSLHLLFDVYFEGSMALKVMRKEG